MRSVISARHFLTENSYLRRNSYFEVSFLTRNSFRSVISLIHFLLIIPISKLVLLFLIIILFMALKYLFLVLFLFYLMVLISLIFRIYFEASFLTRNSYFEVTTFYLSYLIFLIMKFTQYHHLLYDKQHCNNILILH